MGDACDVHCASEVGDTFRINVTDPMACPHVSSSRREHSLTDAEKPFFFGKLVGAKQARIPERRALPKWSVATRVRRCQLPTLSQ